ncbi:hypothetical protein COCNU_03G002230 [Cocos nucifera]|uniref:Uncharacterized protein n=1 Tax=Cocos nucifera TaxID=13894 RepID=A0A8K0I258_COCNU|nr:hypothetical protein COCNU_03G002230 [Cocos nucifera]
MPVKQALIVGSIGIIKSMWRACDFCSRIVYFEDQDKIPKYHLEAAKMHAILKNTSMFFWAYEKGFNKRKLKVKEFLSIDTKFLTLLDIDAKQLLLELWDSPLDTSFKIAKMSLDVVLETGGAQEGMGFIMEPGTENP